MFLSGKFEIVFLDFIKLGFGVNSSQNWFTTNVVLSRIFIETYKQKKRLINIIQIEVHFF